MTELGQLICYTKMKIIQIFAFNQHILYYIILSILRKIHNIEIFTNNLRVLHMIKTKSHQLFCWLESTQANGREGCHHAIIISKEPQGPYRSVCGLSHSYRSLVILFPLLGQDTGLFFGPRQKID